MTNTQKLLEKQAEWQRSRKDLSWPEKVRMAEQVCTTILKLRASGGTGCQSRKGSTPAWRRPLSASPARWPRAANVTGRIAFLE